MTPPQNIEQYLETNRVSLRKGEKMPKTKTKSKS